MYWFAPFTTTLKPRLTQGTRNLRPLYPFRIILRLLEAVGSVLWVRAHFFFWGKGFRRYGVSPSSIEERVKAIAEKVAIDQGLELVHAEVAGPDNKPIVRIFIDKPAGVTHQDCSEVSLHLGTILDVEDFIHSSYTLEVSSPGLDRGLYKRADYERFAGSLAKVKTKRPIGNQRNFRGRLIGIDGDDVLFDDKTNGRVTIPFEAIAKANLDVDFDAELRHR